MYRCKICGHKTHELHDPQLHLEYNQCPHCGFTYKQLMYHQPYELEHEEYNRHNNSFESKGYVEMFERFIKEHIDPLQVSGTVLEFGSGPGPVLKELLRRKGFEMYDFDPFYNNNQEYKNHTYDLITTTEVVEHFKHPMKEFKHLSSLLKEGGYLVVMTSFNQLENPEFLKWWYRRDKTHVSFYKVETFEEIAKQCSLKIVSHNHKNVITLQKQNQS